MPHTHYCRLEPNRYGAMTLSRRNSSPLRQLYLNRKEPKCRIAAFPFTLILVTNDLSAPSVEWLNSNIGLPPIHSQITTTIIINYQLFNACIIFSRSPLPDVEQRSNFNPHFSKMPFFMRSRSACFVPFL